MVLILLLLCTVAVAAEDDRVLSLQEAEQLTGSALENYLKKHQSLFQVGETKEGNDGMKHLIDVKYLRIPEGTKRVTVQLEANEEVPAHFDAREKWKNCPSIPYIRDQSRCGSCWAVSAASAMSDRLCVQSNGKYKMPLSDTDILACCGEPCGEGCSGGWPIEAWKYLVKYGVVSGGRYREKGVCKPYSFHPCGNHPGDIYYGECPAETWPTPRCEKFCQRGYVVPFLKDKHYGLSAYAVANNELEIRKEIMKNGPVQASFDVYEDFRLYKGGIYRHTAGKQTGGHAVKLLGWGTENGTDYWLLANSWSTHWGEQGGYFRMIRGINDCDLENQITAGMMRID